MRVELNRSAVGKTAISLVPDGLGKPGRPPRLDVSLEPRRSDVLFSGLTLYRLAVGQRFAQNAPLAQLFNSRSSKSRARRGSVQRDCIRRAEIGLGEAIARGGPPDTTFFIRRLMCQRNEARKI